MTGHAWLVAGVPREIRHGGNVRAHHIFRVLAERTGASLVESTGARTLAAAIATRGEVRRPGGRLASAQLLTAAAIHLTGRLLEPAAVDLHDHPNLQAEALGFPSDAETRKRVQRLVDANVQRFATIVVPSATFAALCELPEDRTLEVPNGTDTQAIAYLPPPPDPVVGMVSGAAPGRGIEMLIQAFGVVAAAVPDVRLRLGLAATGAASQRYLDRLRAAIRGRSDVSVAEVRHDELSTFLAGTTVLAVPHPPGDYMDAAVPVKLLDAMAAGRPVVVTPRLETARIVGSCGSGVVSASDRVEDFAAALRDVLDNHDRAASMGERARRWATERYDWQILGTRVADALLGPP